MKWELVFAMAAVLLLGLWLVWSPGSRAGANVRPGALTSPIRIGESRGLLETLRLPDGTHEFRILVRDQPPGNAFSEADCRRLLGDHVCERAKAVASSGALFRLFNISSWGGLAWIALGFGGQLLFSGRMFVQWIVSEKQRASTVPVAFWWMSLFGGLALFAYFAWRQDIIGVLGQSSGIVIYGRNLRLIGKSNRRGPAGPGGAHAHGPDSRME